MKKIFVIICMLIGLTACELSAESFAGKEYVLQNAENNAEIILGFDAKDNKYYGSAVNNYFGSYKIDGQNISFGNAGATMMAGPQELMQAEANYLQTLAKVSAYELKNGILLLSTPDEEVLTFEEIK